jgi:hypothetical protein
MLSSMGRLGFARVSRARTHRESCWSGPVWGGRWPRRTLAAMFLGEDLLAWLVLALGAAMAAGSLMALVRPPDRPREGELAAAPLGRSIVMIVVGSVAAIWALASLIAG